MPESLEVIKDPLTVDAYAKLEGSEKYPGITGSVWFMDVPSGMMVEAEVHGLPPYSPGNLAATPPVQPVGPFGFHIHEGADCGLPAEMFMAAGGHYNPTKQPHGNHAGDLPVLFSNDGYAFMVVFTDKMQSKDIVGKTVVIHENPDDFRTQPAGNSGARIACGEIGQVVRAQG